jgi:predicted nucleic acid-binding protein
MELQPSSHRRRNLVRNVRELLAIGFAARVLPFDTSAAEVFAGIAARRYKAGTPVGLADTQIAGMAVSRNATLATHNVRHSH